MKPKSVQHPSQFVNTWSGEPLVYTGALMPQSILIEDGNSVPNSCRNREHPFVLLMRSFDLGVACLCVASWPRTM
jgi:hypothetical protein